MRYLVIAGLLGTALAWASLGKAGPVHGGVGQYITLDGGATAPLSEPVMFRGGQRACVILIGDHDPPVPLSVRIYDEEKNLVVEDAPGLDYCAAIWYPPRDGAYYIELHNGGEQWNRCWLAIK